MPWNKDGTRKKPSSYTMKYQGNPSAFPFKSTEEVSSFEKFAAMGASAGTVPTSATFNPAEHLELPTIKRIFPEETKSIKTKPLPVDLKGPDNKKRVYKPNKKK